LERKKKKKQVFCPILDYWERIVFVVFSFQSFEREVRIWIQLVGGLACFQEI
jgi:hypothetical protein